jgi:Sulfotransferase family
VPVLVAGIVKLLNVVGGGLRALGVPVDRLSDEHLLRAARRRTGFSDFGEYDFRPPMHMLLRSYNEDRRLYASARILMQRRAVARLVNRLLVANELAGHPEIVQAPIRRPIFIASLARTGTTFLHELLAQDPQARSLRAWEVMRPGRWPAAIGREPDPRMRRAERRVKLLKFLFPTLKTMHELSPGGPVECGMLLQNTFLLAAETSPTYREWFLRQPAEVTEAAYRDYRRQLQLLQWQHPREGHWVLKSPVHSYAVDAIRTLFPDSAIVLIHRDPYRVIGSTCSLMSVLYDAMTDDPEWRDALGPNVLRWAAEGLRRTEAARTRAEPGRIYDIHYPDLVADPLGVAQRLYAHFGYPYTPEFRARATGWLQEHPQNKHGAHRYSLEQFGLDRKMIDDALGWYCERHQIRRESSRSPEMAEAGSSRR